MRRFSLVLLSTFTFLALPLVAQGKMMESRLGLGFRDSMAIAGLPALAMNYYPNSEFGMTGALGIDTEENNSKFGLQLGLRKRIFEEDQLNFYMGGAFTLLTQEVATVKKSGYELSALVATEFFLPGLENLGFNLEAGIGVSNVDKVRFRTLGQSFLGAGIFFYL
ncbi:MAG: organic solvent tolerance protein [Bdellovibrionaceae bacterium]|nr:organic solvent tolerance protein [Pseudobdellovibrionaceae bacterium]